jgi:hypothetical protein
MQFRGLEVRGQKTEIRMIKSVISTEGDEVPEVEKSQ